jgi:ribonuclease HI
LQWRSIDLGEGDYMSANVAEYFAVRSALNWLHKSVWKNQVIEVLSDSQVVIRQLDHKYNCYEPKLIVLRDQCLKIAQSFPRVKWTWIRREQNKQADVLSKALQVWGRQATWDEVLKHST